MKIYLGTQNLGKLKDFQILAQNTEWEFLALPHGIQAPDEIGESFADNARIKADYYYKILKAPVLADDSGLCISSLGGFPGVRSAEFALDQGSYAKAFVEILQRLQKQEDRQAYFISFLFLRWDSTQYYFGEGKMQGRIAQQASGGNGFGYDPIFIPETYSQTLADLSSAVKNELSHRAQAWAGLWNQFNLKRD